MDQHVGLARRPVEQLGGLDHVQGRDCVDPRDSQGRTYREVNRARVHAIPVGTLVELENGERLYVKKHRRDCDQTPLYSIGMLHDDGPFSKWSNGYPEESLMPVTKP